MLIKNIQPGKVVGYQISDGRQYAAVKLIDGTHCLLENTEVSDVILRVENKLEIGAIIIIGFLENKAIHKQLLLNADEQMARARINYSDTVAARVVSSCMAFGSVCEVMPNVYFTCNKYCLPVGTKVLMSIDQNKRSGRIYPLIEAVLYDEPLDRSSIMYSYKEEYIEAAHLYSKACRYEAAEVSA